MKYVFLLIISSIVVHDGHAQISFTQHTIIDNLDYANCVYAADIDGDADVDVLCTAWLAQSLIWLENDGEQNFTGHALSGVTSYVNSVHAADMDGDEDVDVVGMAPSQNDLVWWENDGEQGFTFHLISGDYAGAFFVFIANIDQDDDMDILTTAVDADDISWWESDLSPVAIDDEPGVIIPRDFSMNQNYPNPFNPWTTVTFNILQPARVKLEIYDLKGRLVRSLADERTLEAGSHSFSWDGRDKGGLPVSSGVYLYRLKIGSISETKKMVLLR